jgi:DNA-binding GntR family transcriptional regulator
MPSILNRKLKPRKPLGDEVYETVKSAILKGELPPGHRLVEEQLAEQLGASRTPIRQAIHMLFRENLVQQLPKAGFVVQGLSLEDIEEILDLRCVLESHAARKAAENITDKALADLNRLNEAFGKSIDKSTHSRLAELNTDFHYALYELAQSERLNRLIRDLHDHLYRYRVALLRLKDMARTSYQDHQEMISAMADRNPNLTEQLVRQHIEKGKDTILAEARAGKLDFEEEEEEEGK